jgi:hypothetical protein
MPGGQDNKMGTVSEEGYSGKRLSLVVGSFFSLEVPFWGKLSSSLEVIAICRGSHDQRRCI